MDDDWGSQEPEDDVVYEDAIEEEEQTEVCSRAQVYTPQELFGLLSREIQNRIISVFPFVDLSQCLAMLLQRDFQFERILEQMTTIEIGKLKRMYFIEQEAMTLYRQCLICEESERTELTTCCNFICSVCLYRYI